MDQEVRLDKWLWAARFFKTRSLARDAVVGGKVHVNGHRVKPSRLVRIGELIEISRGEYRYQITVDAIGDRRGPASEAAKLYTESEESLTARASLAEERALSRRAAPMPPSGRPDKRSRRHIIRFTRKRED
jgi:ribosome-associated heat shock protein Hsp15